MASGKGTIVCPGATRIEVITTSRTVDANAGGAQGMAFDATARGAMAIAVDARAMTP